MPWISKAVVLSLIAVFIAGLLVATTATMRKQQVSRIELTVPLLVALTVEAVHYLLEFLAMQA